MSYTNTDIIRNHIEYIQPVSDSIFDQLILCDTDAYIKFFSGSITENSIIVKTITDHTPKTTNVTLAQNSFAIYTNPLVRGTVACASDSSFGTIYKENIDYIVDYANAVCTVKSGGLLSLGMTLTFFFVPYTLYNEGSDYRVDYDSGEIQRVTTGDIQLGESLYLDYAPIYNNYTDEIINNAVVEANAIIEQHVDPEKQFGADLVLQSAATYRALEILCRSSAMRELIGKNKKDNATSWIKLAELYLSRSENLIISFKSPMKQIQPPTHS